MMYNSVVLVIDGVKLILNYNVNVGISACVDVIQDRMKDPNSEYYLEVVNDILLPSYDSKLDFYKEFTIKIERK